MKSNPEKFAWELEKARNLIKVFDEQKIFQKPLDFLSVQYYNIVSTESEVIRCRPVQADRPKTTLKILAYK